MSSAALSWYCWYSGHNAVGPGTRSETMGVMGSGWWVAALSSICPSTEEHHLQYCTVYLSISFGVGLVVVEESEYICQRSDGRAEGQGQAAAEWQAWPHGPAGN